MEELLGSQGIGAVAVGDEAEAFWQLPEMAEGHTHRHDAGTNAAVVRDLIAKDGALCGIHDEPDIGLEAAYLDVGFVRGESVPGAIVVAVHERLYAHGGSLAVVGDLLVGDGYVVEVLEGQ